MGLAGGNKPSILIRCLNPTCAVTVRAWKDDFMPTGTVEIRQYCPDHTPPAPFYPIEFYDRGGKKLDGTGWTEVHCL